MVKSAKVSINLVPAILSILSLTVLLPGQSAFSQVTPTAPIGKNDQIWTMGPWIPGNDIDWPSGIVSDSIRHSIKAWNGCINSLGENCTSWVGEACLDVSGRPGIDNGDKLTIAACENRTIPLKTDQIWTINKDGFIVNSLSGKCIDVKGRPGVASGLDLQLWTCEFSGFDDQRGATTDQKWELVQVRLPNVPPEHNPYYFIRNKLSGKCINPVGSPDPYGGWLNLKTRLHLSTCSFK